MRVEKPICLRRAPQPEVQDEHRERRPRQHENRAVITPSAMLYA